MGNIHDYEKALEQKQKRAELKERHKSGLENFLKEIIENSEMHKEYVRQVEDIKENFVNKNSETFNLYKELSDDYLALHENYKNLYETFMQQSKDYGELLEKVSKVSDRYSNLMMFAEHFIVKNNLEEEFMAFIKDIAENEIIKSYQEAAQYKSNLYGIDTFILDEYGMLLEDEEYHQKMAELDKEVI
ncbi:hypothetical protein [Schinkia azotoformans]|uniref:hypothetical protein n=1 Tax=Schinkia azotoformans TaxID=1454 RepID=UPI002DBA5BA2|nr:hypothetical protein [Schinkia azotoformans]MEC1768310.1 hypothetical protein [Schinkia azotoformans]